MAHSQAAPCIDRWVWCTLLLQCKDSHPIDKLKVAPHFGSFQCNARAWFDNTGILLCSNSHYSPSIYHALCLGPNPIPSKSIVCSTANRACTACYGVCVCVCVCAPDSSGKVSKNQFCQFSCNSYNAGCCSQRNLGSS